MTFGLFAINMGVCVDPTTAAAVARSAEQAGFDSIWAGEHVVLPDPQAPPSPLPPETPMLDPTVALTFVAAHTKRVRLGTGIIILPQRNPLVLAKELASLDVLSSGRLIFGVGVGWLEPEFRALGVPFEDRGPRTDDYLSAMLAIWNEANPSYHGRFVSFENVQAHPQPLQKPYPPIVIGGRSPAAYHRAVERGNGWYGWALDLNETAQCLAGIREAARRYSRPAALGELEMSVARRVPVDRDMAQRFGEMGVHRIVLIPQQGSNVDALEGFIDTAGNTLVGRV